MDVKGYQLFGLAVKRMPSGRSTSCNRHSDQRLLRGQRRLARQTA